MDIRIGIHGANKIALLTIVQKIDFHTDIDAENTVRHLWSAMVYSVYWYILPAGHGNEILKGKFSQR